MANGVGEVTTNGEREAMANGESKVTSNGTGPQSPPRRGIWDWARAGTGKLNIIGRLPHPEWKSPGSAPKASDLVVNGAQRPAKTDSPHDDFSIPSTTATEPDNLSQQQLTAAAKIEGLGISALSPMLSSLSPHDFSQTKGSSDDLIANMSETTGSPSPMLFKHAAWTYKDDTTPTGSRAGSPTSPNTPTPPHGRSDSIMDIPKLRGKQNGAETHNANQIVETQPEESSAKLCPSPSAAATNVEGPATPREGVSQEERSNGAGAAEPGTNGSGSGSGTGTGTGTGAGAGAGAALPRTNASARRVPTYKIALAASFLPHGAGARRSASSAAQS
jgi:hypothetical protein